MSAKSLAEQDAARDAENERRLGVCPDRMAAEHLREVIEAISEECWAAGWLDGIELHLWTHRNERGPLRYGRSEITPGDLDKLRALSKACDGWWMWSEENGGELFVRLEEWEATNG